MDVNPGARVRSRAEYLRSCRNAVIGKSYLLMVPSAHAAWRRTSASLSLSAGAGRRSRANRRSRRAPRRPGGGPSLGVLERGDEAGQPRGRRWRRAPTPPDAHVRRRVARGRRPIRSTARPSSIAPSAHAACDRTPASASLSALIRAGHSLAAVDGAERPRRLRRDAGVAVARARRSSGGHGVADVDGAERPCRLTSHAASCP